MNRTIFVTGPSASGKSTLSRRLAHDIGFSWLDTGSVIRMTALVMEQSGIKLPKTYEEALETPCPPWVMEEINQPGEIPISVGGQILDYNNQELRNPRYDTGTLFLARSLRPRTWELLEDIAMSTQAVISSRRVPTSLLQSEDVLPIYLDLLPEERVERRARHEEIVVDADIIERVVGKEKGNIVLGNLVDLSQAHCDNYVFVRNEGTFDESSAKLLLEVIHKFEGYNPVAYEVTLSRLQATPPELKRNTRWNELIESLVINDHPEGYHRVKKE